MNRWYGDLYHQEEEEVGAVEGPLSVRGHDSGDPLMVPFKLFYDCDRVWWALSAINKERRRRRWRWLKHGNYNEN